MTASWEKLEEHVVQLEAENKRLKERLNSALPLPYNLKARAKACGCDNYVTGYYIREQYDGIYKGMSAYVIHWIYTGEMIYRGASPPEPVRYKIEPDTLEYVFPEENA